MGYSGVLTKMESIPIVLTRVGRFLRDRLYLDLPHEAAHLLHLEKDQSFPLSSTWSRNFPKYRRTRENWSDPSLVAINGVATLYGNFDYTLDTKSESVKQPEGEISLLERDGLILKCFGESDIPIEILHATLVRDRSFLAPELASVVRHVQYFPAGNSSYIPRMGNLDYRVVTEDIATMTEYLYAASLFPKLMGDWIGRLHREKVLQLKAEALVTCRFVREESLDYLLDSATLKNATVYDYSPAALSANVFPPFSGYVPTLLVDHELKNVDWPGLKSTFLDPEMVSEVKHPAGTFYSVQTPNNHSADKLLAFVLSRSDLGVLYAFAATPSMIVQKDKTLWISGPKINSPEETVKVNKKIIYEYGLEIQL